MMFHECVLPEFTFAYQPIVDTHTGGLFAYEALVRGSEGESAGRVFSQVSEEQLHRFDRDARMRALQLAGRLGLTTRLSLNFLPLSLQSVPDALTATLAAADEAGVPLENLILEITEAEAVHDPAGFADAADQGAGDDAAL